MTFSLGVLVMLLLIQPLGMRIAIGEIEPSPTPPVGPFLFPRCLATRLPAQSRVALAVPKVFLAVVVAVVAALILGISNIGLRSYNLVADVGGEPKLLPSSSVRRPRRAGTLSHGPASTGPSPCSATRPCGTATLCVPTGARDLPDQRSRGCRCDRHAGPASFSAYGVEACYQFHGYSLADVAEVSLAGGITGQAMSYTSQQFGSWSIVYWIVPVKSGTSTDYERVVLYVQNSGKGVVVQGLTTGDSVRNLGGSLRILETERIGRCSTTAPSSLRLLTNSSGPRRPWRLINHPNPAPSAPRSNLCMSPPVYVKFA